MRSPPCPHCGHPRCPGLAAKLSLGPIGRKRCRACHGVVSVAWLPGMALMVASYMLASLAGMLFASWLGLASMGGFLAAFVGGTLVASVPGLWLYFRYVPLVKRAGPV